MDGPAGLRVNPTIDDYPTISAGAAMLVPPDRGPFGGRGEDQWARDGLERRGGAAAMVDAIEAYDADKGAAARAENKALELAVGAAPAFRFDPDFESAAGIRSHDEKVLHAWRRFHNAPRERIPVQFQRVVAATVALALRSQRP